MPPKQIGFKIFVEKWRKVHAEGQSMTSAQLNSHCGRLWKKMNAQNRASYFESPNNAYAQGRLKSRVKARATEQQQAEKQMKQSIEQIVLKGKAQQDLENTSFMFASFNYFNKQILSNNVVYIPAEFAACQYTLKSGQISIYSTHINPAEPIVRQKSKSLEHSRTHQLPMPPNAFGESNMSRLYANIVEYLRKYQDDQSKSLVVFTSTELLPVVKGCFRYLKQSQEKLESIQVFDIQYLFYVLKKEVMNIAKLSQEHINKHITDTKFLDDYFEFTMDIACQFHEDNERVKYCAQAMVTRWSYMFSEFMCKDLGIQLLPGRHMPPEPEDRIMDESSDNEDQKNFPSMGDAQCNA